MASLNLHMFSAKSLADNCYAASTYRILESSEFVPDVFGASEPICQPWGMREAFCKVWQQQSKQYFGQVLFRRTRKLAYFGHVLFQFGPDRKLDKKPPYHGLSIYNVEASDCTGETRRRFVELCDRIFYELEMDYGFLCMSDEYDAKNIMKDFHHSDGTVEPRKVVGMYWPYCLPGLYWINYFGERYLDQGFGRDIHAMLPKNTSCVGRGIRLQVSNNPCFFKSDEAREKELCIRKMLGESWFYDRDSDRDCNALNISLDELRSP